jgi:molybdenum cofactor cytidylyltransferase
MSSSLRAGITSTMLLPEVDHVLVLVCDQLAVTPELIGELLDLSQKEPGRIIAAFYRGRAGVPCIFPRPYFEELTLLRGDYGARPLLQKYASELRTVPFPAGELDIDTPEDVVRSGLKPFA